MPRSIALTLGEPAGIGPDLTIALWRRRTELDLPPFYVIGDRNFLARRANLLGTPIAFATSTPREAGATFASALPVGDVGTMVTAAPGHPDDTSAPAAITEPLPLACAVGPAMSVKTPIFTTLSDTPSASAAADPIPTVTASEIASAVR